MFHLAGVRVLMLTGLLTLPASVAAEPIVPVDNPEDVVIRFVPVDNTPGGPALDGFVTTDIRFDLGPGDEYVWTQLLIHLDEGGFYRDPLGNPFGFRPRPEDLALSNSLAFDTHVTVSSIGIGGGAADLGASLIAKFPASGGQLLSQAWSPSGAEVTGVTNYTDARLTLTADAAGTFEYLLAAGPGISYRQGIIADGRFVPEPSTGLCCAAVVLFGSHRRRSV